MNILVTGGAGFIGSHFIKYILSEHPDDTVICYDQLTYAGNSAHIDGFMTHPQFVFVKGDIADASAVEQCFQRFDIDCVVNFAAETHVDNSIANPQIFVQTNVLGVCVLLNAVNQHKVKRFHQVSTDEVYGDVPIESSVCFLEDAPLRPSSPYAASKSAGDLLCLSYYKTFGTPITISRCTNNYGKHQHREKLIPKIIDSIQRGAKIPIYGSGLNVRNWIHVWDHCKAIDAILTKGQVGHIYNVASQDNMNNITVAKTIVKLSGASEDCIEYVEDRKGHDAKYAIDGRKISDELSWAPTIQFEDGIQELIFDM